MNNVVNLPQQSDLENFIEFLYDGLEGYVYVVAKQPNESESWDQVFFEYPLQVPIMIEAIKKFSADHEIYIAPALFKSKNALKENVKGSNVLWTEFDGNTPSNFDIPPSMVVRSSEPGHEHIYWRLDEPLYDINALEDYNRRICYKYGADNSAWDANQVLRPPFTINHKRGRLPVTILGNASDLSFNLSVFDDLAPAPEKTVDYSLWEKIDLPNLNDVIYRNKFGPDFKTVFEKTKDEVHDRSTSLTNMAYICAEAGLSDKEIYVVLSHLADRWEKFKHHTPSSRAKQLISIIEHTRIKYPHSNYSDFDQVFEYSPKALLETDIQVEWAIPGMLMSSGIMIFSGVSGIGKTQVGMQFMFHLAMGKPFLGYEIDKPHKIGFFSLEMPDVEVKSFLQSMYPKLIETYTTDEINLLNENLKILPFGENLPLNTQTGQDVLLGYLENNDWDGVFIDSVGSSVMGNLNSAEVMQSWINFNDKVRKRYGCFLWYIHHFRKPPPGQRASGNLEDNYGDMYITARATSVYSMVQSKDGLLRIKNSKNRHAKQQAEFYIKREPGLTFSHQGLAHEEAPVMTKLEQQITGKSNPPVKDDPNPFKD